MNGESAVRGGVGFGVVAASTSFVVGVMSLLGWAVSSPLLIRAGQPDGIRVLPWTGVALIMLGVALAARVTRRSRVALVASGLVLALVVAAVFTGSRDGFAGILFPDALARLGQSGRPATWTSIVLGGLGAAIATGSSRTLAKYTIGIGATVIAGVGLLGVCFYAYGAGPTPLAPQGSDLSLPAVVATVLVAVALVSWRSDVAPGSLFVGRTLGGTLSRGILSTLVAVPVVVGVLIVGGPDRGWWSVERGAVWLAGLGVATPFAVAWVAGRYGDRVTAALRQSEARFQELALYDGLTGLPNRALFMDRLAEALRTRKPGEIAVVYLDLDRFKIINDSLGHLVGDELLVGLARRLSAAIRPVDTAARLSGDEFAVLCDHIGGITAVTSLAERIASAISKPSIVADRDLTVTASVGIAISKAGDTVESLLGNADIAMYQAKKQGRDRIEIFFDSLGSLAQSRFEVEAAIREGLKVGQFDVYYQTQNDLGSARVQGFEALVRWRHPDRGLLVPAQFLTIAEEAGLLGAIGDQVLRQAFAECGATLAASTLELAVNVIPAQVARPGFADWLLELLDDHDVAPEQLCLEMPETSLFATTGPAADTLRTLATHGIRLAVDDFGTGFASLSTLAELPVSVLKIDRSFVARLNNLRRNDDAIIAAVINLSDRLGIQVIAEGVETQPQADELRRLGCHVGQGLHYCIPAAWREIHASAGPIALRTRDRIQQQAS